MCLIDWCLSPQPWDSLWWLELWSQLSCWVISFCYTSSIIFYVCRAMTKIEKHQVEMLWCCSVCSDSTVNISFWFYYWCKAEWDWFNKGCPVAGKCADSGSFPLSSPCVILATCPLGSCCYIRLAFSHFSKKVFYMVSSSMKGSCGKHLISDIISEAVLHLFIKNIFLFLWNLAITCAHT